MARGTGGYGTLVPLAALFLLVANNARRFSGSDFRVYYRAGRAFLAGAQLYRLDDPAWPLQRFRYQPGTAALFAPLAVLPCGAAKVTWVAISALFALAVTAWLQRRSGPRAWFAVPVAWLCFVHPLAQELQLGQVHLLVLAAAVASFVLQDRGREAPAGILIALAAALKVSPILLLGDALLRRRWRVLAGFCGGVGILLALPLLRYGPAGALAEHVAWLESQRRLTADLIYYPINQSLFAIAGRSGAGRWAAAAAAGGVAVLALSARELELRRVLCLCAMVLVTPNGWVQGFVFAVPLTALLLTGPPPLAWCAFALAAATSLLGYDVLGQAAEGWSLSHHVFGLAVVALFVLGRFGGASALSQPTVPVAQPEKASSPGFA